LVCLGLAGLSGSSWLHGGRDVRSLFTEAERNGQRELWGTSRGIRSDEWAVETRRCAPSSSPGSHW